MTDEAPTMRQGREGSRWINQRPSGDEMAEWFKANVPMHEGLDAADYVSGVTLIPNKEKVREVIGVGTDGVTPMTKEVEHQVYTPYAKVETRVVYFHDYMRENEEWLGFIEPVLTKGGTGGKLPPGFFAMAVDQWKNGLEAARFIGCSMQVVIYERASLEEKEVVKDRRTGETEVRRTGKIVMKAAPGTKVVPTVNRYGEADPNAVMKAETGAVGRALAFAGMLVIPGTGVASAEDMQEVAGTDPGADAALTAQPPAPAVPPEHVRQELLHEAASGIAKLREEFPDAYKEFSDWGRQRGVGKLEDMDDSALRGLTTKVQKMLDEAAQDAAAEEPDAEK